MNPSIRLLLALPLLGLTVACSGKDDGSDESTGTDVVDTSGGPKPRRWRVENSWGDDKGRKGFYLMNDSWFDEYVFEIAAPRARLPESLLTALDEPPIVLPPWDPMGALAATR